MAFDKITFYKMIVSAIDDEGRALTPSERVVLLVIANQSDRDGLKARISYQTIMKQTGFAKSTVDNAIRILLKSGWIIQQAKGNPGTNTCSVYRLKGTVDESLQSELEEDLESRRCPHCGHISD